MTEETTEQPRYNVSIHNDAAIAAAVDQEVPKELLSSRSAGGSNTVTYLKGDISVDRLNEIFGPLGWGLVASKPEIEKEVATRTKWEGPSGNKKAKDVEMVVYSVTTQVTLTIKKRTPEGSDTVFVQTGIGYGEVEPGKYAKEAIGMAVKGAETDGLKRCTSMLGKAFGMFLDQDGNQSDIEYAHKGNRTGLSKAKKMRQDKESGRGGNARSGGSRATRNDSRGEYDDGRQQGEGRQSRGNSGGGGRSQQREQPARERNDDRSSDKESRDDGPRGRQQEQDSPADDKPAKSGRSRPRAEVNDDFDLDSEPVTRADQVAYGATIVKRLKDAKNKADREDLIRRHRDSITNLEGNILTRLKEAALQHEIDIDKITG
ncbi:Rad52/Rad22 family DNA repair protein [uncultured Salinicola sp.]|uniref:Rad52/Rad22 family DNA repair protein n=1 Tax=uncultured Salinicola sp. TaxID=1193542 RepID=UPI00260F2013|nr:Rad52/Rad22 family DNA repair protein [uncultured Salinicola sp.]|tara:strand:- start:1847 stop:2968 length:1122 start_codon:yes stop_codon:yes gene_type:complete